MKHDTPKVYSSQLLEPLSNGPRGQKLSQIKKVDLLQEVFGKNHVVVLRGLYFGREEGHDAWSTALWAKNTVGGRVLAEGTTPEGVPFCDFVVPAPPSGDFTSDRGKIKPGDELVLAYSQGQHVIGTCEHFMDGWVPRPEDQRGGTNRERAMGDRHRNIGHRVPEDTVCFDLDMKGGKDGVAFVESKLGPLPETRVTPTKSGGFHRWYRVRRPIRTCKKFTEQGLEVFGHGSWIVDAGSVTASGFEYRFQARPDGSVPDVAYLSEEQEKTLRELLGSDREFDAEGELPPGTKFYPPMSYERALEGVTRKYPHSANGAHHNTILSALGWLRTRVEDPEVLEAVIRQWADDTGAVQHNERSAGAFDRAIASAKTWPYKPTPIRQKNAGTAPAVPAGTPDDFKFASGGVMRPIQVNVRKAIFSDPRFGGFLAYDLMKDCVVTTKCVDLPYVGKIPSGTPWKDIFTKKMTDYLQDVWDLYVSNNITYEGIETVARANEVHPVRDLIRGTTWDGVSRIDSWLTTYLGVAPSEYTKRVGRYWLISGMARMFADCPVSRDIRQARGLRLDPVGSKVDTILILEGKQGKKKSTALEVLALDPRHFLADMKDFRDVESLKKLRGVFIYEIPEFSRFTRKVDVDDMKAFLSVIFDTYRDSYGRLPHQYYRQCIGAGTTNDHVYLVDGTGGRRFWSVRCEGRIDIEALRLDVLQLWAEALALYEQGERWWVDSDDDAEVKLFGEQADARRVPDSDDERLSAALELKDDVREHLETRLIEDEAFGECRIKPNKHKFASMMQALGWHSKKRKVRGRVLNVWVRGDEARAAWEARQPPPPPPCNVTPDDLLISSPNAPLLDFGPAAPEQEARQDTFLADDDFADRFRQAWAKSRPDAAE